MEAINANLLTRGRLEVKVLRVESPLLFWVRLKNEEQTLQELLEELNFRMARRAKYLQCWPENIVEDLDVAVRDGRGWQGMADGPDY